MLVGTFTQKRTSLEAFAENGGSMSGFHKKRGVKKEVFFGVKKYEITKNVFARLSIPKNNFLVTQKNWPKKL